MAKAMTKMQAEHARRHLERLRDEFIAAEAKDIAMRLFLSSGIPSTLLPTEEELRKRWDVDIEDDRQRREFIAQGLRKGAFALDVEAITEKLCKDLDSGQRNPCYYALRHIVDKKGNKIGASYTDTIRKIRGEVDELTKRCNATIEKKLSDAILFDAPLSLPTSYEFFRK